MVQERMLGQWSAGRPFTAAGRLTRTGGRLILGHDVLMFKPLLRFGISQHYPIVDIAAVEAIQDRPPKLRIDLRSGRSVVFIVMPARNAPVWSDDTSARDDAVETISAALSRR